MNDFLQKPKQEKKSTAKELSTINYDSVNTLHQNNTNTGLEKTASQRSDWRVAWSTFRLASHVDQAHSIILKMK